MDVLLATEEDLDALVRIQFAVLLQPVIDGQDTAESRAVMVERHLQHIRANSGLSIAKAQLPDGKVVGFCMFYFPNQTAATEEAQVPTPLRPLKNDASWARITIEAPWIEDLQRRSDAEKALKSIHQEIQAHVAGRRCAYARYMCVDPAFQRQGVGRALMSWACDKFDTLKVEAYLEASTQGEELYKHFDFEVFGHSTTLLGETYSHMWRKAKVETQRS